MLFLKHEAPDQVVVFIAANAGRVRFGDRLVLVRVVPPSFPVPEPKHLGTSGGLLSRGTFFFHDQSFGFYL